MLADPCHPGSLSPEVFAECFQRSSRVLWCVAAAVLGERTHAEDVLQEAAMTALRKLNTFEPGTNVDAWMSQIVRFTALNHRRKLHRRAQTETPGDAEAAAPATPGAGGFDARTTAALRELTEVARTCVLLKTVVELEYAEIATLLDIPAGTAMSHVHRARAKLRELLSDEPEEHAP